LTSAWSCIPTGDALNAKFVSSAAGICSTVACVAWRDAAGAPVRMAAAQHTQVVAVVTCLMVIRLLASDCHAAAADEEEQQVVSCW